MVEIQIHAPTIYYYPIEFNNFYDSLIQWRCNYDVFVCCYFFHSHIPNFLDHNVHLEINNADFNGDLYF